MVIMNIGKFYSLNSTTKFLFKAGLQDTSPKYYHPLTINIWNYPRKLFRIGINMGLLLLKRRPNIDERRERDVLHIFLCRTFKQN
jgi:hypothetical protein